MPRILSAAAVACAIAVAGAACGGSTFGSGVDASTDGTSDDTGSSSSSSSGGGSGSGSSSGGSTSGSSGGSSGSASSGSSSGGASSSGGGCDAACGQSGLFCCAGACVNTFNNPEHCGGCGVHCAPGTYCDGTCKPVPCVDAGATCTNAQTCCGTTCCGSGQLCCQADGNIPPLYPSCFTPTATQPTCPVGCPLCLSDRNLKRDIEPVDEQAVLETLASVPVSTWSYKSDGPGVRHLGPMAQDLYAAFGLGSTDRAYNSVDAHGIALAAIKALYERLQGQDARIERLEQDNRDLRAGVCGPARKEERK